MGDSGDGGSVRVVSEVSVESMERVVSALKRRFRAQVNLSQQITRLGKERKGGEEGGRDGGREGRERWTEGGREGRERWGEGGKEGRRDGRREGGREGWTDGWMDRLTRQGCAHDGRHWPPL